MSNNHRDESGIKTPDSAFYCPLGSSVLWWHGLEYSECPLNPSYRDMPECKNCKLRVDKQWEENKETWKEPDKKKKRRPRNKKRRGGKKK